MRAVVYDRYGPPEVLRVDEVERPVPKEDEVLIKVHATTVNRTDCGWRKAHPFFFRVALGVRRPRRKILGMEVAGVADTVGAAVTEFRAGDKIFGITGFGANAEYVCARESAPVGHMPLGMTFEEAAAVPDGACAALSCLKQAGLQQGQRIVVYGASGSIGSAAVQMAKHKGATVTAVCTTKTANLVRSLGADTVIDYQQEDFTRNGETYDIIFDAVGKHSFRRCRRSLRPGGVFITTDVGFMWHAPILALLTRWIGDKRVKIGISRYRKEDVVQLKELIEAGEYRAVIDRRYPLAEVVEAARYVDSGQKVGSVVLTLNSVATSNRKTYS